MPLAVVESVVEGSFAPGYMYCTLVERFAHGYGGIGRFAPGYAVKAGLLLNTVVGRFAPKYKVEGRLPLDIVFSPGYSQQWNGRLPEDTVAEIGAT